MAYRAADPARGFGHSTTTGLWLSFERNYCQHTHTPLVKADHDLNHATIREKYLTRQDGGSDNRGQPEADSNLLR